ncbi:hypothetical protein [Kaistella antarctica]|uniref:Uncharacterized protein n=1 Tax=Kaistella antarctica TaxID=266748 RepID=A0A448NMI5_9FLAO|nr:hypothetical protein [Kaistella antarctica]KEY20086.1 hypothetical protein HY04_02365 [Kaistella antarctica]SEV93879.1 hypothetical protein SAMN05421765_1297 [Kaistella antarctica]VEH95395.1 Uncharacterised protein [Kaistella antarctica]
MDIKDVNFEIITKQYREKGPAAKGFETLSALMKDDELLSLRILLRNHLQSPIETTLEVDERDNIDFLIDYYSILEIGLIANYFPNPLPAEVEREIEFILKNKFVNQYFTQYYPLILPQILMKQVLESNGEMYFQRQSVENSAGLFDRFLMLNQVKRNDEDINQFLWFLDDGWTGGYSITDFWKVLKDRDLIKDKLDLANNNPLNSSLWGFIKYTQFLADFADLLRDSREDALLQSSFWHYQSYWFEHMKNGLGDIVEIGLKNISESVINLNEAEIIKDKGSFLNSKKEIDEWQESSLELEGVEEDITYLLNQELGEPLRKFYSQSE